MMLSSSASKSERPGVSMDLLSLMRLIVRHWRVTVPTALLTLIGVVGAFSVSSPTYEATGSIVLLGPPDAPKVDATAGQVGQNPFARYGDLSIVGDILARLMDSDSKRTELESQGVTGYDVVANRLQRGPVVEATGKGSSAEAAITSAEIVLKDIDATLAGLQEAEHADPDYYVTSAPLEPASTATAMYSSTLRTVIAVMVLGGLGMLGIAVVAEAIGRRRARPATTEAAPVVADTTDLGTERHTSNGSPGVDWSEISSALQLAPTETPTEAPTGQEVQQDSSRREPGWQQTAPRRSDEPSADNGHRRRKSDRSA
jgi:uncharacterized protein involved in exopolysaccharide biosynthesis